MWRFVCQSMKTYNQKGGRAKNCEGCLISVIVLFFDWVSSLGALLEEPDMVQFGRWGGPTKKALKMFQTIDPTTVLPFEEPRQNNLHRT